MQSELEERRAAAGTRAAELEEKNRLGWDSDDASMSVLVHL